MHRVRILAVLLTVLAGAAVGAPLAAAPVGDDCPAAVPTDEVEVGMTGVGVTVAEGTTRESFAAEVLGVMEGAVGVGRDVIVAELSGPPIERVGGAWFGISGSPVFVDDRLLGATAYLLSGSTTIVGLTPGQDMVDLLDLPDAATTDGGLDAIALDRSTQQAVARATGTTAAAVANQALEPMPVPMAVSGLAPRRLALWRDAMAGRGLPLWPHAAASASGASSSASLRPGDNLGAAISYGDVTAAAVGTATFACGDRVVGFGHPMMATGRTTLGASTADTVAVVEDPVFGSFELARIGDRVGTVDQDRGAGIRARVGEQTPTTPVSSDVADLDTGVTRAGRTEVVLRDLVPDIALSHVLGNIDRVIDRFGPGSSTLDVTVRGRTGTGETFTYERGNRFASDVDIAFESLFEFANDLQVIQRNGVVPVTMTAVDATAAVEEAVRRAAITTVEVSTDGTTWTPITAVGELAVPAGGRVHARVTLRADGTERTVVLVLDVPPDLAGFGFLEVRGGTGQFVDPSVCLFDPAACQVAGGATTIDEIIAALETRARNDDLVLALTTAPDGPVGEVPPGPEAPVVVVDPTAPGGQTGRVVEVRERQDRVVTGIAGVPVVIGDGGDPGGGTATVRRLAGRDRIATSVRASRGAFPETGTTGTVVIARADDHADALTGAPLAARLQAPVLLTWQDRLPADVVAEVERLGASRAIVLGGSSAVRDGVVAALRRTGVARVDRLAGADRYDTARRVAQELGGDQAVLARGTGHGTDGIAASALAAVAGQPVLLTDGASLPDATRRAVTELGVGRVRAVGGVAAIDGEVVAALQRAGVTVSRLAGADRHATSAAVARAALDAGADARRLYVATSRGFPDGLVAAAMAGTTNGVLLLVDGHDPAGSGAARDFLAGLGAVPGATLTVVGGAQAVGEATVAGLVAALSGG